MIVENNISKSRENSLQHNSWKGKIYEISMWNFGKFCNLETNWISMDNDLPNISDRKTKTKTLG